jgi:hypothetical protein
MAMEVHVFQSRVRGRGETSGVSMLR